MNNGFLSDKYAIVPDIIYLHSFDGKPLRNVYPLWSVKNNDKYTEYAESYRKSVEEVGENSFEGLRQILKYEILDKLVEGGAVKEKDPICRKIGAILNGLLPVSLFMLLKDEKWAEKMAERRKIWTLTGEGVFGAITCGMQVDFEPLVGYSRLIRDGIFSNDEYEKERALRDLDKLVLEVRQMNFFGNVMTGWASVCASFVNAMRAAYLSDEEIEKLIEASKDSALNIRSKMQADKRRFLVSNVSLQNGEPVVYRGLLDLLDGLTIKYANTINGVVTDGLKRIRAGKFYKPADDFWHVRLILTSPVERIVEYYNSLTGKERPEKIANGFKKIIEKSFKDLYEWQRKGILDDKQAKKITTEYEKKGKIPKGMTEDFTRSVVAEYRAYTRRY